MDERTAALIESLLDEEARASQLADLDDDGLDALADDLRTAADEYRGRDDYSDEDLEQIRRIKDAFEVVKAEQAAREQAAEQEAAAAAQRAAEANEALAELSDDAPVEGGDGEGDEGGDDEGEGEGEEPAPETTSEAEPVQAKARRRPSLSELARRAPAMDAKPRVENARPRWQLIDGTTNVGREEIAERINAAREALIEAPAGFRDKVPVARIQANYGTDRTFDAGDDPVDVMERLEPIVASAKHPDTWTPEQQAIVAAGGFCAPPEPRYDVYNISDAARPVRDGLARVGVTRGAITVVPAAHLSYIVTSGSAGSAVSKWTNATDITPGGTTKPIQTFACRATQTCTLQAIVARGKFGNFMGRAFPELVADDVDLMMAAHARVAEVALLDGLIDAINMDVAQTGFFGTARDVKNHSMQVAANIRSWERSNTPIRGFVAREVLPMIVHDVVAQQASGELDAVTADEAWARSLLGTTGLLWTYAMDTPSGSDAFQFATDGANLPDYPDNFEMPFIPEGSGLFLDGGRLDLGIVRDSTLNNTNDYELFVETFEGVCFLGPYAMTLTLTTCPNGESQAPSDITTVCSGS